MCAPCSHRDSFELFCFKQGDHPCTVRDGPTKRPQYMRISRLITVTYLLVLTWKFPMVPAFNYNKILAFAPVCSRQSRIGLWFRLADVSGRRHSVDRSFDGSFRVDGHAELDGPPLPFQVSLPVPLGNGTLGRRVAPLSVSSHIHKCVWPCANPG